MRHKAVLVAFFSSSVYEDAPGWISLGNKAQAFTMNSICQHLRPDFPVSMTVANKYCCP